jgi:hypothetical protein
MNNLTNIQAADPASSSNPMFTALLSLTTLIQLQHQTVTYLMDQNSALHAKLDRLLAINDPTTATSSPPENSNDAEEKERLRSVVISGVPEIDPSAKAPQRRVANQQSVMEILDVLDIDVEPSCVYRMGVSSRHRPRLIKVVLPNSATQRLLLKKSKGLKNSPLNNIYIRPSLTRIQLDREYNLRQELRERRGRGEKVRIAGGPPGSIEREIIVIKTTKGSHKS